MLKDAFGWGSLVYTGFTQGLEETSGKTKAQILVSDLVSSLRLKI